MAGRSRGDASFHEHVYHCKDVRAGAFVLLGPSAHACLWRSVQFSFVALVVPLLVAQATTTDVHRCVLPGRPTRDVVFSDVLRDGNTMLKVCVCLGGIEFKCATEPAVLKAQKGVQGIPHRKCPGSALKSMNPAASDEAPQCLYSMNQIIKASSIRSHHALQSRLPRSEAACPDFFGCPSKSQTLHSARAHLREFTGMQKFDIADTSNRIGVRLLVWLGQGR
eukprot:scaffold315623_cov18-Tisochrysis_lutea.AAC.2